MKKVNRVIDQLISKVAPAATAEASVRSSCVNDGRCPPETGSYYPHGVRRSGRVLCC